MNSIHSTNTETEQQQQLSHSKDHDYYVARGQKYALFGLNTI